MVRFAVTLLVASIAAVAAARVLIQLRRSRSTDVPRPIRRRQLRLPRQRDPRRRLAADPSGRPAGAAGTERHRQVDRAAPAGRRPAGRQRRRARARARHASPTCASRRSSRAAARCSTRCSSRSPICSSCTTRWPRSRRAWRDGEPAELARYGELQERYQREGGYELEARVQAPDRRRRLHRGRSRPRRSTRCRAASAAGWSWPRCWCASPTCCCSTSRPTTSISPPSSGSRAYLAEYPGAFVLVSHDRAFIRAVCSEIVELENGKFVALPVRLRQVRRRARRAPDRARAGRVRAAEGARRQDRGLHPPQPRRAEDQAGAEPAQDAGEAGAPRAPRGPVGARRARSASRFSTGGDLGGKEIIRAPNLTSATRARRSCAT